MRPDFTLLALQMSHRSAELANSCYISEDTVKTYLKRIYAKLDVRSRDEPRTFVADLMS